MMGLLCLCDIKREPLSIIQPALSNQPPPHHAVHLQPSPCPGHCHIGSGCPGCDCECSSTATRTCRKLPQMRSPCHVSMTQELDQRVAHMRRQRL
ncbi:unnamed protein product [Mycena citricolor]|uniref:Uncharacterized protein n=1 Tax=Mycena citricolor TaxID=2018698 RepID=A0AAD2K3X3_9AGAR|nr:unnamed protein product [Mycena citricolor]